MATLSMLHAVDPREDLLKKIGNLDHIDVFSNHVLVATYVRPTTTKKPMKKNAFSISKINQCF